MTTNFPRSQSHSAGMTLLHTKQEKKGFALERNGVAELRWHLSEAADIWATNPY